MKFDLCNISQGRQPMLTITLERGAHEHTGTSGIVHTFTEVLECPWVSLTDGNIQRYFHLEIGDIRLVSTNLR